MSELTKAQLETVRAGLDWLYNTEQANHESIVSHHGINAPVVEGRRYSFVPSGFHAGPVVVVEVAKPRYTTGPLSDHALVNPLGRGELTALALQIERFGYPFHSTWNGKLDTGSVGLTVAAHPSLLAALERQRKGCPDHPQQVLCSWDGCPWYRTHIAQLQVPEGW